MKHWRMHVRYVLRHASHAFVGFLPPVTVSQPPAMRTSPVVSKVAVWATRDWALETAGRTAKRKAAERAVARRRVVRPIINVALAQRE